MFLMQKCGLTRVSSNHRFIWMPLACKLHTTHISCVRWLRMSPVNGRDCPVGHRLFQGCIWYNLPHFYHSSLLQLPYNIMPFSIYCNLIMYTCLKIKYSSPSDCTCFFLYNKSDSVITGTHFVSQLHLLSTHKPL